jgi:hypothetical protein
MANYLSIDIIPFSKYCTCTVDFDILKDEFHPFINLKISSGKKDEKLSNIAKEDKTL